MVLSHAQERLTVEPTGESSGRCDCCGRQSRHVWGFVLSQEETVAAYFVHWTIGHLADVGANIDFIIGRWGDDTLSKDRVAVSLVHREQEDGAPAIMVIDAAERPVAASDLVGRALARDEVIGTPLATTVFALIDAIYLHDGRFF